MALLLTLLTRTKSSFVRRGLCYLRGAKTADRKENKMLTEIKYWFYGVILNIAKVLKLYNSPETNPNINPAGVSLSMVNQSVNHAIDTLVPNLLLAYFVTKKKNSLKILDGWLKLGNAAVNINNLTANYPKLSIVLKEELTEAVQVVVRKNIKL